jgi:hypothetical protein
MKSPLYRCCKCGTLFEPNILFKCRNASCLHDQCIHCDTMSKLEPVQFQSLSKPNLPLPVLPVSHSGFFSAHHPGQVLQSNSSSRNGPDPGIGQAQNNTRRARNGTQPKNRKRRSKSVPAGSHEPGPATDLSFLNNFPSILSYLPDPLSPQVPPTARNHTSTAGFAPAPEFGLSQSSLPGLDLTSNLNFPSMATGFPAAIGTQTSFLSTNISASHLCCSCGEFHGIMACGHAPCPSCVLI